MSSGASAGNGKHRMLLVCVPAGDARGGRGEAFSVAGGSGTVAGSCGFRAAHHEHSNTTNLHNLCECSLFFNTLKMLHHSAYAASSTRQEP